MVRFGDARALDYLGRLDRQLKLSGFRVEPGEIDLPGFPLFGLFNCAMGVTTVIPDMDPSRPARVDPAKILEAAEDWGRTRHREYHTGHLHSIAAYESISGVIVRTAPSLSSIDSWHNENGFVGALRGMEAFYYHKRGGFLGTDITCPAFWDDPQ